MSPQPPLFLPSYAHENQILALQSIKPHTGILKYQAQTHNKKEFGKFGYRRELWPENKKKATQIILVIVSTDQL